jgi:hypothetical protein
MRNDAMKDDGDKVLIAVANFVKAKSSAFTAREICDEVFPLKTEIDDLDARFLLIEQYLHVAFKFNVISKTPQGTFIKEG